MRHCDNSRNVFTMAVMAESRFKAELWPHVTSGCAQREPFFNVRGNN